MRGRSQLGDMSQIITSDFNKIQVKEKQILRKSKHVSYFTFVGESWWILTLTLCTSSLEGSEDPLAAKTDSVVKVRNRRKWQ
jgi:hypothetical protein